VSDSPAVLAAGGMPMLLGYNDDMRQLCYDVAGVVPPWSFDEEEEYRREQFRRHQKQLHVIGVDFF